MSDTEATTDGLTRAIHRQIAIASEATMARIQIALAGQVSQRAPLSEVDFAEWERNAVVQAMLPVASVWEELTPEQRQTGGMTVAFSILREVLKMGLTGVRLTRELAAQAKSS